MRNISFSLKPNVVYHFILHANDEVFSFEPLPATRHIVTMSIGESHTLYPIELYCAGACSCSLEILFSLTEDTKRNPRPFIEHLLETLEDEFRYFWSSAPEPMFCDMQILRCRSDGEAEQRLFEITCRPVEYGLVDRVEDWLGFSVYKQLAGV